MTARIIVEIPDNFEDAEGGLTLWKVTRAVLDAFEPGASAHCLQRVWPVESHRPTGWKHHRLGITVELED